MVHTQHTQAGADEVAWAQISAWAHELGFDQIGVADVDLRTAEPGLLAWLAAGYHGEMHYMAAHGLKRARPAELVPGTLRAITVRMNYLSPDTPPDWVDRAWQRLAQPMAANVSLYAHGRDYHKVMRARLQQLAQRMAAAGRPLGYRVFVDSAPVLEAELAQRAGLGWRGKHTLVLNRQAGSMAFLGEILVDWPLPVTPPVTAHCGRCRACLDACPTRAIVAPYRLDARRCISYLTIEHPGPIPETLRPALGNRIYGCDDCQLACPWNKFAQPAVVVDFAARAPWRDASLCELALWDEPTFLQRTEGSPIRRIGFARWQRNLAVALGNALRAGASSGTGSTQAVRSALMRLFTQGSELVREHAHWAINQGLKPHDGAALTPSPPPGSAPPTASKP